MFIAAVGVLTLLGVCWLHSLGDFAKSPQTVTIQAGRMAIVAGGRASLYYGGFPQGTPYFEIKCKGTDQVLELSEDEESQACGIHVRLVRLTDHKPRGIPSAECVVTWTD